MSWGYWDEYERRPPRPANGIRAQSRRGQFGKTWWAGRWIAALERLVDPGRLSRGRSYARAGQVVKLEIGRAEVSARVQGSRPQPYRVSIRFRELSDAEWERVADAMTAQAIYAAKLLSGEMPREIEEVFAAAGASLLPAEKGDLQTDCSCPDWANPCKHVAAVHYLLGEQFDADPFLMFELRGRGRDEMLVALRATRAAEGLEEWAAVVEEPPQGLQEEEAIPLVSVAPIAFWTTGADVAELSTSFEPPPVDALLVKRLGAPPFWQGSGDFTGPMEQAYRAIAAHARRMVMGRE